jgi:hypothetical protein
VAGVGAGGVDAAGAGDQVSKSAVQKMPERVRA